MKLKSYFAESVDAALSQASRDLGPDAVLLNSRRTNADHKQLGEYEVVCGVTNEPPSDPGSTAPHADAAAKTDDLDQLAHEILGLRQQIERLSLTYSRSSASMSALAENPELLKVFMTLTDAGLEGELAHEVIRRMRPETSLDSARAALADLITIDSGIGKLNSDQCVCALIGPPGSGKTTALVSMAVRFSVAARKPCQLLTLDLHRVAAAEQLRTYAAILGVGFQVVETPAAFAQTLKSIGSQYIILIDTPGLSRAEMEYGSELARIFSKFPEIDTHLVLPASMQSADLKHVIQEYEIFHPNKLLFTKLDETCALGTLLNQTAYARKPLSFFCFGQRIPEDFEMASRKTLIEGILKEDSAAQTLGAAAA